MELDLSVVDVLPVCGFQVGLGGLVFDGKLSLLAVLVDFVGDLPLGLAGLSWDFSWDSTLFSVSIDD